MKSYGPAVVLRPTQHRWLPVLEEGGAILVSHLYHPVQPYLFLSLSLTNTIAVWEELNHHVMTHLKCWFYSRQR